MGWAALAVGLVLVGCVDERVEVLQSGPPSYYEDVTPILARACWCCHQSGGIASPLETVERVEMEAAAILEAVQSGAMPPGSTIGGATCAPLAVGSFSDADLDVLRAWSDAGMPRGVAERGAPVPARCRLLGDPAPRRFDNGGWRPERTDDAHCFVLPADFERDEFLTGARFLPGGSSVRSITLQPTPTPYVAGDDFACPMVPGSTLVSPAPLAYWEPGAGDLVLPAGSGIRIAAGALLTLRVVYVGAVLGDEITTGVELALTSRVDREGGFALAYDDAIAIEPGATAAERTSTALIFGDRRIEAVGILTHDRGQEASLELATGTRSTCLLRVSGWGLHGRVFPLASALPVSGHSLRARCVFDTRADEETTTWGDSPRGDVCIGFAYVTW